MAHHENPAHYGNRPKHHKLIFFYGLPLDAPGAMKQPAEAWLEMYDLDRDPFEMNNVVRDSSYADVLEDLKQKLLLEKERIGDWDEPYEALMQVRQWIW